MNKDDQHYQNALALYALIQDNVEEIAQKVCSSKDSNVEYLDAARLGCYKAWCDRLCHSLTDLQINYFVELFEKKIDKGL